MIKFIINIFKWFFLQKANAQTMKLIPIKVKIGLRPNGHADHPDWTKLPMIESDLETRNYAPSSWIYAECGHQESTLDSPRGMQWGMMLVTREFADEALQVLPDIISELTPAEAKIFFTEKCRSEMPENRVNDRILSGLASELQLRESLSQDVTELKVKIAKALDPLDKEPGVKKNPLKKWDDYLEDNGFTV